MGESNVLHGAIIDYLSESPATIGAIMSHGIRYLGYWGTTHEVGHAITINHVCELLEAGAIYKGFGLLHLKEQ